MVGTDRQTNTDLELQLNKANSHNLRARKTMFSQTVLFILKLYSQQCCQLITLYFTVSQYVRKIYS